MEFIRDYAGNVFLIVIICYRMFRKSFSNPIHPCFIFVALHD